MVSVVQLAERQFVDLEVGGSRPLVHPTKKGIPKGFLFFYFTILHPTLVMVFSFFTSQLKVAYFLSKIF